MYAKFTPEVMGSQAPDMNQAQAERAAQFIDKYVSDPEDLVYDAEAFQPEGYEAWIVGVDIHADYNRDSAEAAANVQGEAYYWPGYTKLAVVGEWEVTTFLRTASEVVAFVNALEDELSYLSMPKHFIGRIKFARGTPHKLPCKSYVTTA